MWWIVALVLSTLVGWGQQLELFTARQGVNVALQRAQQEGFRDAALLGLSYIGQMGELSMIQPRFDLETGKANYWLYAVRSAQRDTTLLYAVIKLPFVGYQVIPLGGLPTLPGPGMGMQPLPATWMDSDSLVLLLRQNSLYRDFRQRYPDSLPDFVTLGVGMVPGVPGVLAPVWTVAFLGAPQEPNTSMTCFVWRAQGAEVECFSGPVEVREDAAGASVRLFPHPASGWVEIELPEAWCGRVYRAELYDLFGRRLAWWRLQAESCRHRLSLPAVPGTYLVRLEGKEVRIQRPLVVMP